MSYRIQADDRLPPGAVDPEGTALAYESLREITAARSVAELPALLERAVRSFGGTCLDARAEDPRALPLDISLGFGAPRLAVADPASLARLRLERHLPDLVQAALDLAERLGSSEPPDGSPSGSDVRRSAARAGVHFAELQELGDARAGEAWADALLDAGWAPDAVLEDILVPAQHHVGLRWERGEWEPSDEHRASGVAEAALRVLADRSRTEPTEGCVVAACAEGEWHVLAVRAIALCLRTRGWDVDVVGPGAPADLLGEHVQRVRPVAVVLSVTQPTALIGAQRCIDVAHDLDVPVLAGGIAFGGDGERARRLGAAGWALSARRANHLLAGWRARGVSPPAPAPVGARSLEAHDLLAARDELLPAVVAGLPPSTARVAELLRGELERLLDVVAAALLVGDRILVGEQVAWLLRVLGARGMAADRVAVPLEDAVRATATGFPTTSAWLAASVDQLRSSADSQPSRQPMSTTDSWG